ncbi:sulfurtransferase TusA family protein [Ferrovibrio sp.]|uniref:sulfurtransferase TusA family protein n=1 Tax=Ferrovibrio sp. TaxID=1917215 RepID=UPI0026332F47|nr:sulfurtransferase TusA family protein [Ferrovibrio sp.]
MSQMLDVKGLNCPLPVLRAKKAMKTVAKGDVLTVEATDPNTMRDMAALCEASGFTLLSSEEQNGVFVFRIQQAA